MAHALTPRYRWSLTALRLGIKERVLLHLTPAQYKKNWVHDHTETVYSFIKRVCLFFLVGLSCFRTNGASSTQWREGAASQRA
jgi:hypothetical protein